MAPHDTDKLSPEVEGDAEEDRDIPRCPDTRKPSGDDTVSWITALSFFLIGVVATVSQSIVMWALFIFLYIIIVLVGWIPFVMLGGIIAAVGWRFAKVHWYGFGLIVGALALHWPLAIDWYLIG